MVRGGWYPQKKMKRVDVRVPGLTNVGVVCKGKKKYRIKERQEAARRTTAATATKPSTKASYYHLSPMNALCIHCSAKHFAAERTQSGHFSTCCSNGKVLSNLRPIHPYLREVFTNPDHMDFNYFQENSRYLNSAFSFCSLGLKIDNPPPCAYYLIGRGELFHRVSPLHQEDSSYTNANMPYCSAYSCNIETATRLRYEAAKLNPRILHDISVITQENSALAQQYLHAYEKEQEMIRRQQPRPTVYIQLSPGPAVAGIHVGRTNLPTTREDVAVLYGDHDGLPRQQHQLLIQHRATPNTDPLQIVKIVNPLLDAMLYLLLDPYSIIGWHTGIRHAITTEVRKYVTIRLHAVHQMTIRDDLEYLHDTGKLFQQWLVDKALQVEEDKLQWLQENQTALRLDSLQNIGDFNNPARRNSLTNQTNRETSVPILLPSSFIGGPRHALNTMRDMLAMSMQLGAATFFVTFTANPA
ncbi:uncharacterized protein LOC143266200 [Megachile rotundata]|uniref:uncharacterized protein LOC143266200 n=1 Tax=Megachile rotundata TaxID=143995 RepID=UPI003FD38578